MEKEKLNLEQIPEEYGKLLKSYRKSDDEIGTELQEKINSKLREITPEKKPATVLTAFFKFVSAAAAAVAIIFAIVLLVSPPDENVEKISESTVAKGDPVTINLVYDAAGDFENVRFSIELDEGISFLSANEKIRNTRTRQWTGNLKKGKNSIPFVVKTEHDGRMTITTSAEYGSYSHRHKIVLDAQKNDIKVSMFAFKPVALN